MKPKRNKEKNESQHINPYCFFKLILSPSIQFKKLRIPKISARKLRNELPSTVILKVPTGETRKVEVFEEDNELWFRNGWQKFVEYFSIGLAYFLVFKYEGNSKFFVHIFDLTACEISYECNVSKAKYKPCPKGIDIDSDDDEKPEIMKISSNSSEKSGVEAMQLDSEDDKEQCSSTKIDSYWTSYWLKNRKGLMEGVDAAGISWPNNPFFVVSIKSYVLNKGYYLNIPMPFGREYLRCEKNQYKLVNLEVEASDGRQWEVKCVRDYTKYAFRQGWINFARQIGLEVGEVCVFELINANEYVFKVHVAKSSQINPDEAELI